MDKFRRMEIFVAVVETGQLTRAAKSLHLSKSAVSYALSDLEKYLGSQLLMRNTRSWQLTDAGKIYFEQCKKILADIEAMEDYTRQETQKLSGLIRVSSPDTFGSYTLAPILSKFMDMHPAIIIEMNLSERFVDIIEERVDVAFRTGHMSDSSLVTQTLGSAQTGIFASPRYLEQHGIPQTHVDLKNHKCITYTRSPKWKFSKEGRNYSFTPRNHLLTDSGENMREFCIRGQGLANMPSMLAEFALKKSRLAPVLTDYEYIKMPIQALRASGNRAPIRVIKLLEFVAAEFRAKKRDIAEFERVEAE